MNRNKRLVPICIIYKDGVRLNVAGEGAFRSVRLIDSLDAIGECTVCFDYLELGKENEKAFGPSCYESNLSVHLGYKDDTREVFNGRITAIGVNHWEHGPSLYTITASSYLSLLHHGKHTRTFENMTPSQAVKKTLERYGLQVDCEPFGAVIPYWQSREKTDWETVKETAKRYGMDICCFGKNVYIKQLMTHLKDEHIYEWGKSVISFETDLSLEKQTGQVSALGWNWLEDQAVRGTAAIENLTQKIGGRKDFKKLVSSSQPCASQVSYIYDHMVKDEAEAKELDKAVLREKSFTLLAGEGTIEGDPRLAPGATVTIKYVGEGFSGEYIAKTVIQRFSLEEGYTTDFYLKRNMVDEDFMKGVIHVDTRVGSGVPNTRKAEKPAPQDVYGDEENRTQPKYRNLVWRKGAKRVSKASAGEQVNVHCEVRNIPEGETVTFSVYELEGNVPIAEIQGEVRNSEAEAYWEVAVDRAAEDGAVELCFTVTYNGVESHEGYALEVSVPKEILSVRCLDSDGNETAICSTGNPLTLEAVCSASIEEDAEVTFTIYPEGASPGQDEPVETLTANVRQGRARVELNRETVGRIAGAVIGGLAGGAPGVAIGGAIGGRVGRRLDKIVTTTAGGGVHGRRFFVRASSAGCEEVQSADVEVEEEDRSEFLIAIDPGHFVGHGGHGPNASRRTPQMPSLTRNPDGNLVPDWESVDSRLFNSNASYHSSILTCNSQDKI